ncbi:Motility protein B [Sodalis praecaptivus]|nr:Motility protein B [Sodalis praecaptivus]
MQKPIIIVRKRKLARASGAHAGSWKIVFADFMTSMMAFFLVM